MTKSSSSSRLPSNSKKPSNYSYQYMKKPAQVRTYNNFGVVDKAPKATPKTLTVTNWLVCFKPHQSSPKRPSRELLERALHLTRYYCRFVLQLCAVLSQLNEHEQALHYSKEASMLAKDLCLMTEILLVDEIRPAK